MLVDWWVLKMLTYVSNTTVVGILGVHTCACLQCTHVCMSTMYTRVVYLLMFIL